MDWPSFLWGYGAGAAVVLTNHAIRDALIRWRNRRERR